MPWWSRSKRKDLSCPVTTFLTSARLHAGFVVLVALSVSSLDGFFDFMADTDCTVDCSTKILQTLSSDATLGASSLICQRNTTMSGEPIGSNSPTTGVISSVPLIELGCSTVHSPTGPKRSCHYALAGMNTLPMYISCVLIHYHACSDYSRADV